MISVVGDKKKTLHLDVLVILTTLFVNFVQKISQSAGFLI